MFWDDFPLIMAHNKHIHFFLFEPVLVQHWMGHIPRCQFSLSGFVLLHTLQSPYFLQNIILLWPLPEIALLLVWHFFSSLLDCHTRNYYKFIGEFYELSIIHVDFTISVPFYLISVILACGLLLLLPLIFPHFMLYNCIPQIGK
jgi:hypothetical protein